MTTLAQAPLIDVDGVYRHDGWRRRWRTGGRSQAIGMLCHHGMARALTLTAPPGPRPPAPRLGGVVTASATVVRMRRRHAGGRPDDP